jgi:hypothetical protein
MEEPGLLQLYGRSRDRFFQDLTARLLGDSRVQAAWLSGAHGRDEDDEWSDFDLHVAVADESCPSLLADPGELFELAGEVILVQANFPSDSMPDGRFWLVVYPGPFHVDWNIGPISAARRPRASRPLFERRLVPPAEDPSPLPAEQARQSAQQALEFFWAMLPIAVKYAGRGWTRRAVQQEALLSAAWQRLWRVANGERLRSQDKYDQNRPPSFEMLAATPAFGSTIDGPALIEVLEGYCTAVEGLHPALAALGVDVPARMPFEVRRLLEVAGDEIKRGQMRDGSGARR